SRSFSKIERYKEILIQKISPDLILFFGLFARRDFNEGSDVDILVVADFKQPHPLPSIRSPLI
ncbi:MAG: nucleotidyltransferase domain-containing protein, partial [Nitrososphaerota archaeon]